jgi:hypothetical protein
MGSRSQPVLVSPGLTRSKRADPDNDGTVDAKELKVSCFALDNVRSQFACPSGFSRLRCHRNIQTPFGPRMGSAGSYLSFLCRELRAQ